MHRAGLVGKVTQVGSIYLIRHGQASFGSDNYDVLSTLGHQQASCLGQSWEAFEFELTHAVAGSMQRHAQTAIETIDTCGVGDGYDIDSGWDEFDHMAIAASADPGAVDKDPAKFQRLLNKGLDRWIAGESSIGEAYADFVQRVNSSFQAVVDAAGPGQKVVVFTSGGPIALVTSYLLAGDDSLFQRLNDVIVNASVTTILAGSTGPRLLTFNEHTHLPRDLVTFR